MFERVDASHLSSCLCIFSFLKVPFCLAHPPPPSGAGAVQHIQKVESDPLQMNLKTKPMESISILGPVLCADSLDCPRHPLSDPVVHPWRFLHPAPLQGCLHQSERDQPTRIRQLSCPWLHQALTLLVVALSSPQRSEISTKRQNQRFDSYAGMSLLSDGHLIYFSLTCRRRTYAWGEPFGRPMERPMERPVEDNKEDA